MACFFVIFKPPQCFAMKRAYLIVVGIVIAALILLGPQPQSPEFPNTLPAVPAGSAQLENYVAQKEGRHSIKPGNGARIVWQDDSTRHRTEYALVYLHGFSASHHEGFPVHINLAEKFGSNLYLARLHRHGIDTSDALLEFTASGYYRSALEALAIGKQVGKRVVLMGTSTGCTAALKLAADFPDDVHAVVNLSPNIKIKDPTAFLLNNPWGGQLARLVLGDDYRYVDGGPEYAKYWNDKYRIESLPELEELVESTMTEETFSQVQQPVFNGYYFKNEKEQDQVVDIDAIREMHTQLSTPDSLKVLHAFPEAGNHVLASPIKSGDVEGVERAVTEFLSTAVGMTP